ncbi:MAG: hypothetical protein R3Y61_01065 [Rikenellaceae bacterium]
MKSTSITLIIILAALISFSILGIYYDSSKANKNNGAGFIHNFIEYGFSIEAPCQMQDVSSQSNLDCLVNYAGTTDKNDLSKMAFYQLMVIRLPVGYKDLAADKLKIAVDSKLKEVTNNFTQRKSITFGYEGYKGYEVKTRHNNMDQVGVFFFNNENLIIALTVISNNDIEQKFNKFTNGFSSSSNTKPVVTRESVEPENYSAQNLDFGYSFSLPCKLEKMQQSGFDYTYIGGINKENPETGIIYKVCANKFPQSYSSMLNYDKKAIKNNILNYIKSKGDYKEMRLPIKNYCSYAFDYTESNYKVKECLILVDEYLIELIMFSMIPFESYFDEFCRSIREI